MENILCKCNAAAFARKLMMEICPFNGVFFVLAAFIVVAVVLIWYIFRNKSENAKRAVINAICAVNIVFFFVYKYCLSQDTQFLEISNLQSFNWFKELPIQLCNINMFLIPISLITKKRAMYGFSFFLGSLGAFMALIFPEKPFTNYSLFLMRNMGFYFTHSLIIICAISLATLGFFRTKFKDIPSSTAAFVIISVIIHFVNMLLRATVCPEANYFFTYGADISILNLFWNWIPIPYLYELPAMLILVPYMLVITSGFEFAKYRKNKKSVQTIDNTEEPELVRSINKK